LLLADLELVSAVAFSARCRGGDVGVPVDDMDVSGRVTGPIW
jgi:hypothetical protein